MARGPAGGAGPVARVCPGGGGGQGKDDVRPVEGGGRGGGVGHVARDARGGGGDGGRVGARAGFQVVEDAHAPSGGGQRFDGVRADEASAAGDETDISH